MHVDPGRRKRASKPKVKTGCFTCRLRRVKCDEAKPECLRCIKFGIQCDGYPKVGEAQRKPLPLLPLLAKHEKQETWAPLHRHVVSLRFENGDEARYFRLFCEKTARHLGGYYDSALWNRLILQASEAESSIRHAVIAIGALDKIMSESKGHRRGELSAIEPAAGPKNIDEHHVFALQQYSKAIGDIRKGISSETLDLRIALVASLLIICFETIHENSESASRQVYTAMMMIEGSRSKQVHNMSDPLRCCFPAPRDVEEELIQALVRQDFHCMVNNDPYSRVEHISMMYSGTAVLQSMPEQFTNIVDARSYFNNWGRHVVHYWRMISPICLDESESPGLSYSENVRARDHVLDEAKRFMAAFQPLFDQTRNPKHPNHGHFLAAGTLRLGYLAAWLSVKHSLDDETEYDAALDYFVEMNALARNLQELDQLSIFTFDAQFVVSTEIVAMKCRDPSVRREAIHLLASKPRREGISDSLLTAKMCSWVMSLEEEGMVNGFVPEEYRIRFIRVKYDSDSRVVILSCEQPLRRGRSGEVKKHRTTIKW